MIVDFYPDLEVAGLTDEQTRKLFGEAYDWYQDRVSSLITDDAIEVMHDKTSVLIADFLPEDTVAAIIEELDTGFDHDALTEIRHMIGDEPVINLHMFRIPEQGWFNLSPTLWLCLKAVHARLKQSDEDRNVKPPAGMRIEGTYSRPGFSYLPSHADDIKPFRFANLSLGPVQHTTSNGNYTHEAGALLLFNGRLQHAVAKNTDSPARYSVRVG